jgi:hypothetical protein
VSGLYRRQSRVSFVLSCIEDKSVLALVCVEDKAESGLVLVCVEDKSALVLVCIEDKAELSFVSKTKRSSECNSKQQPCCLRLLIR